MTQLSNFDVVFEKVAEMMADDRNTEFTVSFVEASPDERDAIDELRRLSLEVSSVTGVSFVTA